MSGAPLAPSPAAHRARRRLAPAPARLASGPAAAAGHGWVGVGVEAWGGGGGGGARGPLSPPLFPALRPHPLDLFFFSSQVLLPGYPPLHPKAPRDWVSGRVRQSDCDVQSSCFLQLCLKVNLVVERSPQRRERSGVRHPCSRASGGAGSLAESARSAGLRAFPLLFFSSASFALLLSSLFFSSRSLSPLPTLSARSPLSHSPHHWLAVAHSPSLVQLFYSPPARAARARARAVLSPAGAQTQRGAVPLRSAPRKYLLSPRQSPPLFQSHLCWLVLQWEEKRDSPDLDACQHLFFFLSLPTPPGENGVI